MMPVTTLNLQNFTLYTDDQQINWLKIDCVGSSVNRLSAAVLQELNQALDYLSSHQPKALIIYSGKTAGFIAGADIDEFSEHNNNPEKGLALVTRGWTVFNKLAKQSYPTLALVQGHCLGGGLELALACRYCLAVDQTDTRLALPEVMLGIFPGWGGMLRLPEYIGPAAAMDLMLSGKSVDARKAARLGMVDACVPVRLAKQAAVKQVLSGKKPRRASGLPRLMNTKLLRPLVAGQVRKQLEKRDPYQHYQAPRAILEIWEKHNGNALKAPELIEQITRSDTAVNLLRVFHLQERLKSVGKHSNTQEVGHVHVVGAGVMGGDIAAVCALKGLRVTLQDQDRKRIAQAQGRAAKLFQRRLKDRRLVQAALDRLIPDPDGHGIPSADLVLEAIFENVEAKRSLYASIEPKLKPTAVLATNTSSLPLSKLSLNLTKPERLVGIHFFNPVSRMPLIEVVESELLAPEVRSAAYAFVNQIGKLPLPVKDSPGFLVNAVLAPYMLEAMRCVDEGLDPATVDKAMLQFGMPMGPLELADTVGLDIARDAGAQLSQQAVMPACLKTHLDRQELGRKTGQGFYTWKDGKAQKPPAGTVPSGLADRLIKPLIEQTEHQVRIGVVEDEDLADAGVIFGTGFAPFRGGPLHYKATQKQRN